MTAAVRPRVGISWTAKLEPLLSDRASPVHWVEFEPQTTWLADNNGRTSATRAVIERLQRYPGPKLVHSVACPVGGMRRPTRQELALLRDVARELGAPFISEHLSFNEAHGICTGFFLPPRQTEAQVQVVADNICRFRDAIGVPVAIENGTSYLRPRKDEMRDGEFVAQIAEKADCGLLLDLHNAYTNAVNGRQSLAAFLGDLPLDRVWELHLAGGMQRDGFWLDAHSGPVPAPLWELIDGLPGALPALQAVIFEMFPTFIGDGGVELVAAELERIDGWLERKPSHRVTEAATAGPLTLIGPQAGENESGESWEIALAELVTGQSAGEVDDTMTALWRDRLAPEPGVQLLRQLVYSFRASMLVQNLPLTMRLLMANLGTKAVEVILHDAFAHEPPRLYASIEVESFARHMMRRRLPVPHFAEVLQYELALTRTLIDGQSRVVTFSAEPLPLLRALADGRLPDEIPREGAFEIELVGDGAGVC